MANCAQRTAGIVNAHGSAISNRGWLRVHAGTVIASMLFIFSAGCINNSVSAQQTQPPTFTTIYNFGAAGSHDGREPLATLVRDSAGNLYGTTALGGSSANCSNGCGTVFKIDSSGDGSVLASFAGGDDGWMPVGGLLLDSTGNLYGTTYLGGSSASCGYPVGCGTVYKIDPSGSKTLLHSFAGGTDGVGPRGTLIMDSDGKLYGTTYGGEWGPLGNVFSMDASGNATVLHNFTGGADGNSPNAGLIMGSESNLYGTTYAGGSSSDCPAGIGCGTVFKIDSSGNETVLYDFTGGTDGRGPDGSLIVDSVGNLYGTASGVYSANYGTVFKIYPSGNFSVLHSFTGSDGKRPEAELFMDPAGNLYGTTRYGGSSANCYDGCGTVFKIDSSGNFFVLHSFAGSDGAAPYSGLIMDPAGSLYGTTSAGGSFGWGTVFKIAFATPFSAFSAKLDITAGPPPGFQLNALFTQGSGAGAIDPVAQGMTLAVGPYTATIPAGAFHMTKKGLFVYEGTTNGVALQLRILQTGTNSYQAQLDASGMDLTSLTNPVPVTLTIGSNTGTTQVTAGHGL